MIFSTYEFIFGFLPIVFIGYFIMHYKHLHNLAKIYLVMASLFFYAQGSASFFPFFLGSILGNYIIGSRLCKMTDSLVERKLLFVIGVIGNVGLLCYYKYTDFFIQNINQLTGASFALKGIVLPIGISFFTFQLITYLVDSYRGKGKNYDIVDYLLFITFFPQLIVGPIVHHAEMIPQFENDDNQSLNFDNIALGVFIFSVGLSKKMLLADPLTISAQAYFNGVGTHELTMLASWFHSIEYTVSYYFDLSGYADMAVGMGCMFNIVIPQNFNSPYKATDFQEYWKRWHMTLSRFLGSYIFQSIYKKDNKYLNYYVATMVTFAVSGLWHGAGWTFVVWGIANGALVCLASYRKRKGKRLPFLWGLSLTFLFVVLLRVLFVSNTFSDASMIYLSMIDIKTMNMENIIEFTQREKTAKLITIIALVICWFAPNTQKICESFQTTWKFIAISGALLTFSIWEMNRVVEFLYFQF